ncbi:transporter substrate-binding domain-containing protein [Romeria aff. gracilis LEGE 07310]|uniref:Transporter substrate-binding domain-containing protein n=1 Tax=Vasconcelosia minhoensis LEGE 07310 TaxID=915328 RepID=A0A8J7AI19_9CYAN|nr:transporter substrate-binding domain-containing protein [Romeria gracilis]MBE9079496.1 transporter substrate-binding domain-containing protein [Romeria aff. gracilis LEGE 07310]
MLRYLFGIAGWLALQMAMPSSGLAADLAEIQSRGYLIIAVQEDRPPLGFRDSSGELAGFEVDLAHRLAEALLGDANAVQLRPVSNVDRVNAVLADEVDLAIAAVTLTEPRRRLVSFSDPYYLDGTGFIAQSQDVQQLSDLRLRTIALLQGSSAIAHVRYRLPAARLVGVESYQAALALIEQGEVDAFAGDISVLVGWAQQDSTYRLLPEVISVEPLAVVLPKGVQYDELRTGVNAAIRGWAEQGWLNEWAADWGLR